MKPRNERFGVLGGLMVAMAATLPVQGEWIRTVIPGDVVVPPSWSGDVELTGVNSNGVVCGNGNYVANVSSTVFRFDGTTITELPHLVPADPMSYSKGINASGVICGYSHNEQGMSRACYWDGNSVYAIPYPADAVTDKDLRAYAINDAGVVIGYGYRADSGEDDNDQIAFYFKDGVSYSLDSIIRAAGLVDHQIPAGINNNGLICGTAWDSAETRVPWTYHIDTGVLTVLPLMGTYFKYNTATDVNDQGVVLGYGKVSVGNSNKAHTYDGMAWSVVDASVSTSHFSKVINNNGRVLSVNAAGSIRQSWYSDDPGTAGSMVDIVVSGTGTEWYYESAEDLNDAGWIVGSGKITSSDAKSGFILTPPAGDGDMDGDVDLDDLSVLVDCLSGPIGASAFVAPSHKCINAFDFAAKDGDVDLEDFAVFQRAFGD